MHSKKCSKWLYISVLIANCWSFQMLCNANYKNLTKQQVQLITYIEDCTVKNLFERFFVKSKTKNLSILEPSFDLCIDYFIFRLAMKPHEQWWENSLGSQVSMTTFSQWLGDINAPSRIAFRKHLKTKEYTSILDIPCGLCIDFYGIKHDNLVIDYYGIDITKKLVERAHAQEINVQQGSIEKIPMQDASIDVAYARHILEHLDYYEKAVDELVRVAKREAIIVFFITPTDEPDIINLSTCDGSLLYHNHYNKQNLIEYVRSLDAVQDIQWEEVSENESILHIYLESKKEYN